MISSTRGRRRVSKCENVLEGAGLRVKRRARRDVSSRAREAPWPELGETYPDVG
jgi:hypothetical protein